MCPVFTQDASQQLPSSATPTPLKSCSNPTRLNVAGVSCVAWTQRGRQARYARKSEVIHAIWLAERVAWAERGWEHGFFLECSGRYPVIDKLVKALPDMFHVVFVFDSPTFHDFPNTRFRLLAFCSSKRTLRWAGPPSIELVQQDYRARFHKQLQLPGDMLFAAPQSQVHSEYIKLAARQGYSLSSKDLREGNIDMTDLLRMVLPPGAVANTLAWKKSLNIPKGSYKIVDVEQHVGHATSDKVWPSMSTHGFMMRIAGGTNLQWRLATGLEHLGVLGLHLFNGRTTNACPLSPTFRYLKDLPAGHQKRLAGNSMSLITQASFMAYCLGNIEPALQPSVPRPIPSPEDGPRSKRLRRRMTCFAL